ncbi:glycosyl hydrolase, family 31 [Bifidobacterium ramosum]|uniref:Alpha-glucosidase n=1 Tax=Bifidobacterium ramosum TaxID=1798158 RepID=A0A6L4X3F8_9BIFI|nr:TIM-barrel domain-containing protein [Bifidobacterium ramosum]KAB8288427.1 glycosyl hydrolase, family 31 [Bifidobacterium ramosum]NEG71539.1 alpha-glucosidase [Bifidobacterium ramosum]
MATSPNPQDFKVDAAPAMRADSTIVGDRWRIGLLTDSLVRFEWSDSGDFENRPTQTVLNRDFGEPVQYTVTERDGRIIIDTAALYITYDKQPFSKEGLSVVVKGVSDTQFNTWHYGDEQRGNLKGTARTLDEANGAIPLDDGVISRDGWAVIDDSASNIIVEADEINGKHNPFGSWVTPRDTAETDLYFFGYGHRYIEAVHDFYRLTGPTPLLPRWALSNWWSRYYRYTQDGYLALMDRFKRAGLPFTTSVIDMDWHRVDDVDPKYGSGWTGYSWNRTLFPDPPQFLRDLHARGLHTTLNVHPRDGVRAFEDAYPEVASRVGIDPATEEAVEFDLTNPQFVDAYFDMHHRMEDDGVDFWWLDWQQGGVTRQKGLDPLWMLNHMHYLDSGRDGRWPLTFSRYAGPGSHRYPVGFSGDTIVTWESLAFQPQFTATASNIGYGWWSHDIGGHMFGYRDEELEARWYQLGAFSPINRLHSSSSPFVGKEPWNFRAEICDAMTDVLRLRHAMLPYLYTMDYRAARDGRPLVEPMYWQSPDIADAYEVPDEFRFGTELIVAPVVSPNDRAVQRGRAEVWLPDGEWFDFFDGRRYVSRGVSGRGRRLEAWRAIDRMPVFAKAGGIVPLQEVAGAGAGDAVNAVDNPRALRVLVFPGADGAFTLREDNGTLAAAKAGRTADTSMTFTWGGAGAAGAGASVFAVAPVAGDVTAVPDKRDWTVVFRGVAPVADADVRVLAGGQSVDAAAVSVTYDEATLSLSVSVAGIASTEGLRIEIADGLRIADNPIEADVMELLLHTQMLYRTKELALNAVQELGVGALDAIRTMNRGPRYDNDFWVTEMPDAVAGALAEILLRS